MQNIIMALAFMLITHLSAYSQCDKKVTWHAAKSEIIDENGTVLDTDENVVHFTADNKNITINVEDESGKVLTGDVAETNCEWKEAYKNGKTVYKATLYKGDSSDSSPATITIEATDGKITIILEIEKMEGRKVKLVVDKYEEE